jgi:hypothetical protein
MDKQEQSKTGKYIKLFSRFTAYFSWIIFWSVLLTILHGKYYSFIFGEKTGLGRIERLDNPMPYCIGLFIASVWLSLCKYHSRSNLFITAIIFWSFWLYDAWFLATFSGVYMAYASIAIAASQATAYKIKAR